MFRRGAGGKKRDTAEGPIVDALRAVGVRVWYLGGVGLPDLLCCYRGRYSVFEVKTGKGRKTAAQVDIPWPVVRTPEEALMEIFGSLKIPIDNLTA